MCLLYVHTSDNKYVHNSYNKKTTTTSILEVIAAFVVFLVTSVVQHILIHMLVLIDKCQQLSEIAQSRFF